MPTINIGACACCGASTKCKVPVAVELLDITVPCIYLTFSGVGRVRRLRPITYALVRLTYDDGATEELTAAEINARGNAEGGWSLHGPTTAEQWNTYDVSGVAKMTLTMYMCLNPNSVVRATVELSNSEEVNNLTFSDVVSVTWSDISPVVQ